MNKSSQRRHAFTLIELLVAMAIMLAIAALAAAFLPGLSSSSRVTDSANQLQAWLIGAKTIGARDKVVTGLRIFADDPANPTTASTIQFIQQPDPLSGGNLLPDTPANRLQFTTAIPYVPPGGYKANDTRLLLNGGLLNYASAGTITFLNVDFSIGGLPQDQWLVQPGDSLEVVKSGGVYSITSLPVPPLGHSATQVKLSSSSYAQSLNLTKPTTNYRIFRQPRPISGEPIHTLPNNTVIDLAAMQSHGMNIPSRVPGSYDILFYPAGGIVSGGVGQYILWLRDSSVTINPKDVGGQALVAISIQGGRIRVVDVAAGARPFQFANQ